MAQLAELAAALQPDLARQVFTHSSWAPERTLSYERLEFLGDSVLGICISTDIFARYPDYNEGELTKLRAYVISGHTCAKVAREMGLADRLAQIAEEADAVNVGSLVKNVKVLAALMEALIGAVYIQFGLEPIIAAVVEAFDQHIVAYAASEYVDYKTVLQEEVAKLGQEVVYKVIGSEGPPHAREFTSEVVLSGEALGWGQGRTKKVSQQEAAKQALDVLKTRKEGV